MNSSDVVTNLPAKEKAVELMMGKHFTVQSLIDLPAELTEQEKYEGVIHVILLRNKQGLVIGHYVGKTVDAVQRWREHESAFATSIAILNGTAAKRGRSVRRLYMFAAENNLIPEFKVLANMPVANEADAAMLVLGECMWITSLGGFETAGKMTAYQDFLEISKAMTNNGFTHNAMGNSEGQNAECALGLLDYKHIVKRYDDPYDGCPRTRLDNVTNKPRPVELCAYPAGFQPHLHYKIFGTAGMLCRNCWSKALKRVHGAPPIGIRGGRHDSAVKQCNNCPAKTPGRVHG